MGNWDKVNGKLGNEHGKWEIGNGKLGNEKWEIKKGK